MTVEIRCIAKSPNTGHWCGSFVTRAPLGTTQTLVGMVGHSSLADPANHVYACTICGRLHEVKEEAVAVRLDSAA